MSLGRMNLRYLVVACGVLLVGILSGTALATPSPSSLTVGVGGTVPFSGGPITGSTDASGNVDPAACFAPACESIPVTLQGAAPITLTARMTFDAPATNPQGLTGLDIYILDSTNKVVGSDPHGSSPATAIAANLSPGNYKLQVTGENGAFNETYSGTLAASVAGASAIPTATQVGKLNFSPATAVSPVILGGEPQMSFERPVASPKAGAGLDPNRGFVDWPLSSRSQIGTLWRTINGGDSYRQLVDLQCAPRQRPNCYTGGGGDTVNRVNNYDGTVNFGDQEVLVAEGYASSVDHGDSFPLTRQTPVTAAGTGVDRQWISTVDAGGVTGGATPVELQALYSYHVPLVGEYVAGVRSDGTVVPALTPVITGVSQSGPSRIDVQPGSKGYGLFYQGYRDGGGFEVASAPIASYQDPLTYAPRVRNVDPLMPSIFPWINLDRRGNLYAVWVTDGQLYYKYSLISIAANDPTVGGVPGTTWSPKLKINPPYLGSTVFPEVVAGDAGRIAIAYMGTTDHTGPSDLAPSGPNPPAARWSTYVSSSIDALSPTPSFRTGTVSHRFNHLGSICTSGTTCMGDRSLLDMIDTTIDADGRTAVVYTDNNNSFGFQSEPYVKVAKLATGPSLYSAGADYNLTYPTAYRPSAAGDATWPNTATGKNLPALDITGNGVSIVGDKVVAEIRLSEANKAAFARDLAAYSSVSSADLPASRLQYVTKWEFGNDVYYVAAQTDPAGAITYGGGKVDPSDAVSNGTAAVGVSYRPQGAFPVTGEVKANSIFLSAPLSAFGLKLGSTLVSYQSFSFAGASDEALAGFAPSSQVIASIRNIDAAPPMDAVLALSTNTAANSAGGGANAGTGGRNGRALPNTARPVPDLAGRAALLGLAVLAVAGLKVRRKVAP